MSVQITNTLTSFITATEDSTGNVVINRGNGNPAVDSTTALFVEQFKTLGAAVDTPIPFTVGAEIDQLYIKNNDAAAIITVKWTKSGGGAANVIDLQPGGLLNFWEPTTGKGVLSVTVASSIGSTFCEIFVGVI